MPSACRRPGKAATTFLRAAKKMTINCICSSVRAAQQKPSSSPHQLLLLSDFLTFPPSLPTLSYNLTKLIQKKFIRFRKLPQKQQQHLENNEANRNIRHAETQTAWPRPTWKSIIRYDPRADYYQERILGSHNLRLLNPSLSKLKKISEPGSLCSSNRMAAAVKEMMLIAAAAAAALTSTTMTIALLPQPPVEFVNEPLSGTLLLLPLLIPIYPHHLVTRFFNSRCCSLTQSRSGATAAYAATYYTTRR